jgi:hypothetical protein
VYCGLLSERGNEWNGMQWNEPCVGSEWSLWLCANGFVMDHNPNVTSERDW